MRHPTTSIQRRFVGPITMLSLLGMVIVGSLAAAGCYRHTISRDGIGSRYSGERIREPNVEDPNAPLFPWFGDDDEDDGVTVRRPSSPR